MPIKKQKKVARRLTTHAGAAFFFLLINLIYFSVYQYRNDNLLSTTQSLENFLYYGSYLQLLFVILNWVWFGFALGDSIKILKTDWNSQKLLGSKGGFGGIALVLAISGIILPVSTILFFLRCTDLLTLFPLKTQLDIIKAIDPKTVCILSIYSSSALFVTFIMTLAFGKKAKAELNGNNQANQNFNNQNNQQYYANNPFAQQNPYGYQQQPVQQNQQYNNGYNLPYYGQQQTPYYNNNYYSQYSYQLPYQALPYQQQTQNQYQQNPYNYGQQTQTQQSVQQNQQTTQQTAQNQFNYYGQQTAQQQTPAVQKTETQKPWYENTDWTEQMKNKKF